jgi:hypothetical protein
MVYKIALNRHLKIKDVKEEKVKTEPKLNNEKNISNETNKTNEECISDEKNILNKLIEVVESKTLKDNLKNHTIIKSI